jgi:hypothetical protein
LDYWECDLKYIISSAISLAIGMNILKSILSFFMKEEIKISVEYFDFD